MPQGGRLPSVPAFALILKCWVQLASGLSGEAKSASLWKGWALLMASEVLESQVSGADNASIS